MAHTFNSSTQEEEAGYLCEYKATLVYKVSPGRPGFYYTEKPYLKKPEGKKKDLMYTVSSNQSQQKFQVNSDSS